MLIDTHAHLDFEQFHDDREKVLKNAKKAGVEKIINVGSSLQGSIDSVKLAQSCDQIYAAVGIHPEDIDGINGNVMAQITELAQKPKVVAIGEIGLDYFHNSKNKEKQKREMIVQIGIARRFSLPLIIHCRDAENDVLEILKEEAEGLKGVLHCFSGDWIFAKKILDIGFLISFTGAITYKQKKKENEDPRGCEYKSDVHKAIEKIPLEKMMVETDSPFLTPEPYRGKRNEPAYVVEVAKKIAEIKNISFSEVAKTATKNAENLFKL